MRRCSTAATKTTVDCATGGFDQAVADIAWMMRAIEMAPDALLQVRRARNLGVLVMQLTYNRTTPFGIGCLDGETPRLTKVGHDAVAKMNALGVAIDVSHANTQTTADAIAASAKPVVMSHAGCHAIHPHPRNKEDREMKALANRGGVMGIYMLPFLAPSPVQPTLEIYMKHLTHAQPQGHRGAESGRRQHTGGALLCTHPGAERPAKDLRSRTRYGSAAIRRG